MTIRASEKLTVEAFISAPRRSSAIPNADGTFALYTKSIYSLESHTERKETGVLDLKSRASFLLSDDDKNKEYAWLEDNEVLWLREAEGDTTEIWSGRALGAERHAYLVGTVPGPASNLRTKSLTDGSFAVIVIGKASEDGSYHNPTKPAKPRSSARVYDKLPIRIWDTYVTAERKSIWYTRLERRTAQSNRWSLSETGFVNALEGTNLEHPDPNPLLGADFDVSATGILFTAVDPLTIRFLSSKHDSYYVSLETFQEHPASRPQKISVSGYSGSSSCPTFSPDGKSAAFLKAQDPVDEYDRSRIFILHSIDNVEDLSEIVTTTDKETWDLQPTGLKFSCDAKDLYITADFCGNSRLYSVPTATHPKKPITAIPKPLTTVGSVSSLYTVSPTKLLVSTSSYVDSSTFAILDPKTSESRQISSLTSNGSAFGLRPSQVSSITFRGAGDYDVQAFIVTPSSCDPHKKYPMLLWVHGGPVSVWTNAWSTRWNPVVFAEQGYVVVACNPTGSLGFGEDYVQGVKGEWGGRPYVDLVGCFEYVKENVKFVDTEKAVAMGGSYGGYMMNWIAGQPFAKSFRALVNHDGIFSIPNMLASDVPTTLITDFRGALWENRAGWDKWDPSRYTHNWNTPMLIIHSDKDFRCPITEGLAAFTVWPGTRGRKSILDV